MPQRQKRYQRWTKEGIKWTPWFNITGESDEPVQMKCFKGITLKNEYRTV